MPRKNAVTNLAEQNYMGKGIQPTSHVPDFCSQK